MVLNKKYYLTAAFILCLTLSACSAGNREKDETGSGITAEVSNGSEDEITAEGGNGSDTETGDEANTGATEKEPADTGEGTETAIADDPCLAPYYFKELYEDGKLQLQNTAVTLDTSDSDGVLISGSAEDLNKERFLIDEDLDFGSAKIQRIMINGLGQKDCITEIGIYLDGAKEPAASITLAAQTDEDLRAQATKNANALVTEQNITGKHRVELSVCQYSEGGKEKTPADAQVLLESIQFVAESIPLINIRIDESLGTIADMNNDEAHNTRCTGVFDIIVPDDYAGDYTDEAVSGTYEMEFIKGRGNSTWTAGLRLPYKLKLAEACDLFGMGSNKNWALLANAYDNDLIRNAFTYRLGEALELSYTPQCVCVDVMMNGEYLGNYLLCESIRVDRGRIEIDDLDSETDAENITGGYLLGAGAWGADEDAYVFTTKYGVEFNVNSPGDSESPSYEAEMTYIVNYMQRIENALRGEPDPETGEVIDPFDLMDLDSAVKYYWIQELCVNGDFCKTGSTYCYKERDGKLYWGPIWDFDVAWAENDITSDSWRNQVGWFQLMLSNEKFVEAAEAFYINTLAPLLYDMTAEEGYCDNYYERIRYSAINSLSIWGFRQADYTYEKGLSRAEVTARFDESHQLFTDSVKHRIKWCSDNLDSLKTEPVTVIFMAEDEILETRIGYVNAAVTPFPEDPVLPGKRFIEWTYRGIDFEGNECGMPFNQYVTIPESALESEDGVTRLLVTASLEDRDEAREVKSLQFQQASYQLYLDDASVENWTDIMMQLDPADGYADEIIWNVSDDSVIDFIPSAASISVCPKKVGTAIITGTLMNGTTGSISITVSALEAKP